MEITVGLKGEATALVERCDTAFEVGSGNLLVYATPCMAALMEGAACDALEGFLPEGKTSVGIELQLHHTAATPVGMEVRADAELTDIQGSILTFQITVFDEAGQIGDALHKRAIVTSQRFLDKTYAKL